MALWKDNRWRRGKVMKRRPKKTLALLAPKVTALTCMAAVLFLVPRSQELLGVALHDGSLSQLC